MIVSISETMMDHHFMGRRPLSTSYFLQCVLICANNVLVKWFSIARRSSCQLSLISRFIINAFLYFWLILFLTIIINIMYFKQNIEMLTIVIFFCLLFYLQVCNKTHKKLLFHRFSGVSSVFCLLLL